MKVFIDAHVECVTLIVAKKALNHKDQGFWLNGICVFCVRLDEMFRRHFYIMGVGIFVIVKGILRKDIIMSKLRPWLKWTETGMRMQKRE